MTPVSLNILKAVWGNGATVDDVKASDSISNVASRTSKKKELSWRSTVSSSSSARIKAGADVAALFACQGLLKDKHAVEEQDEQLNLEMEIAASVAKVNVLRSSASRVSSAVLGKSDGMNSYLEREQKNAQTLNAKSVISAYFCR